MGLQSHEGDVSTCHIVVITCATVAACLVVITLVRRSSVRYYCGRRECRSCKDEEERHTENDSGAGGDELNGFVILFPFKIRSKPSFLCFPLWFRQGKLMYTTGYCTTFNSCCFI